MKKTISIVLGIGLLVAGASYLLTPSEPNLANVQIATASATIPSFESVADLETASDLIVIGKFTGDRSDYTLEVKSDWSIPLSKSEVKVEKAFKGDKTSGDKIVVVEEAAVENNRYVNTEGYKWMEEKGTYCLFLRKVEKSDFYAIVGIYQGKFDLNIKAYKKHPHTNEGMKAALLDQGVEFMGSDLEHFKKLKDEVVVKYK